MLLVIVKLYTEFSELFSYTAIYVHIYVKEKEKLDKLCP